MRDPTPANDTLKLAPRAVFSSEYRERKNLRIAAYIRVSTDRKEQESSFNTQLEHYKAFVAQHPGWVLTKIYADDGISGTSTKHRDGFRQMLADAQSGEFDMLVTKSVSRYARNLVDGVKTARELLNLPIPIGILFEEENLNTFRPDSEFILSVLLLVAQAESEKKSAAVRKAFQWRCDAHRYFTPVNALLGYEKDENGTMVIEPEGAKTVRAIYALFLNGRSPSRIARILTASGKRTGKDNPTWRASSVLGVLRNERYCGDVTAQKTVTTNVLEHKSERNRGQQTLYYHGNHHEGIITRPEHVWAVILSRAKTTSPYYNPYYEVRVVRTGLLTGFIPINLAFGGYCAAHYIGASNRSNSAIDTARVTPTPDADLHIVRIQDTDTHDAAQLTIASTSMIFSAGCTCTLQGVRYAEILLHPTEKLLTVRPSTADNRDAIPWPSRTLAALPFCKTLFELMGWADHWRYRVTADYHYRADEAVLIFNLSDPEYFIDSEPTSKRRAKQFKQSSRWRAAFGVSPNDSTMDCRRSMAREMTSWHIDAPALPVPGYPSHPSRMTDPELQEYLNKQGVQYE